MLKNRTWGWVASLLLFSGCGAEGSGPQPVSDKDTVRILEAGQTAASAILSGAAVTLNSAVYARGLDKQQRDVVLVVLSDDPNLCSHLTYGGVQAASTNLQLAFFAAGEGDYGPGTAHVSTGAHVTQLDARCTNTLVSQVVEPDSQGNSRTISTDVGYAAGFTGHITGFDPQLGVQGTFAVSTQQAIQTQPRVGAATYLLNGAITGSIAGAFNATSCANLARFLKTTPVFPGVQPLAVTSGVWPGAPAGLSCIN